MTIQVWKWDGKIEPNALNSDIPSWVTESYERGKLMTIFDRKTNIKYISIESNYGSLKAFKNNYVLFLNNSNFLVLTAEDYATLIR